MIVSCLRQELNHATKIACIALWRRTDLLRALVSRVNRRECIRTDSLVRSTSESRLGRGRGCRRWDASQRVLTCRASSRLCDCPAFVDGIRPDNRRDAAGAAETAKANFITRPRGMTLAGHDVRQNFVVIIVTGVALALSTRLRAARPRPETSMAGGSANRLSRERWRWR